MSDITKADKVYVSTSKNGDYVSAVDDGDSVTFIRADLVPQWLPIETAPKYDGNGHPWILVYNAMAKIVEMKIADGDWWRKMGKDCPHTHWQPLPNPPPAT